MEELEATEVVRGEHELTVVGAVGGVDVAAIGAVRPHTEHWEAEDAWLGLGLGLGLLLPPAAAMPATGAVPPLGVEGRAAARPPAATASAIGPCRRPRPRGHQRSGR